jgi:hypothetical protein
MDFGGGELADEVQQFGEQGSVGGPTPLVAGEGSCRSSGQ